MASDLEQPYNGTEGYLFASYARDDSNRVLPVLRELRKSGVRVWWDQAIQPGQRFGAEIERRLDGAAGLVVFLSSRALQSDWILQETKHASEQRKDLIPVMLEGSALPLEWKSLIGRIQHIAAERLSPDSIADEVKHRAKELGCGEETDHAEGAFSMRQAGPSSSSIPWIIVVLLAVALSVIATLYFAGGGGREASRNANDGAREEVRPASAPEVPSSYLAALGDESRIWKWSLKSARDNNSVTLHWEQCKGVENIRGSNLESFSGTVDQVRAVTRTLPLRACRFCYEIEFNRKMKEARLNAGSAAGK
jgi:hypothetical protein